MSGKGKGVRESEIEVRKSELIKERGKREIKREERYIENDI